MHETTVDSSGTARGLGVVCTLVLALSGCSESGGSSDEAATPATTPARDDQPITFPVLTIPTLSAPPATTPPVTTPPTTTPPVTTPPVTTPPVTTPPVTTPPVTTPPVTTPPVTTPPVTTPPSTTPPVTMPPSTTPPVVDPPAGEPLDALLGTLGFEWSFRLASTVFRESVRFDADALVTNDAGQTLLVTTDSGEWDDGFGCLDLDDVADRFLCSGFFGNGDINIFVFELDDSGTRGAGIFEFCVAEDRDGCAADLAATPDGTVTVSIDGLAKLAANGSSGARDANVVTADHEVYMTGLDQADASRTATRTLATSTRLDEPAERVCRALGACSR